MKNRIIAILSAILFFTIGYADNISINNTTIWPGETQTMTISLSSVASSSVGVQFDLVLPDGFSLEKNGGELYSISTNQPSDLACNVKDVGNGSYRFVLYSNSLQSLKAGELISVYLKASSSISLSNYIVSLDDIRFSDSNGKVTKDSESQATVIVGNESLISLENTTIKPGETKAIMISLSSAVTSSVGVQFDMILPNGFSLEKVGGELYTISTNQARDLTCNVMDLGNGSYRFVLYSNSLQYLRAGNLLSVNLKAGSNISNTSYTISLTEIGFSDIDGKVTKESAFQASIKSVKTTNIFTLYYIVDGRTYKSYELESGTVIIPEAEPTKEGYTFSGWSYIPSTMPEEDVTVTGSFSINKYTLTYMVDGEVYKSYDIEYGATIYPEAEPTKYGYSFSGWSWIPSTMPAHDVTVTGNFTSDTTLYNLRITASGNGTVSYNGNAIRNRTQSYYLDEGSSVTLTFSPDEDYQIKYVKVNGSTVNISNNQYMISSINRNITVEVEFEAIPIPTYSLSITATGNGSASYNGTKIRGATKSFTVKEGASATISFLPDNGCRIKSLKVNGSVVSVSNNQYVISSISENTTVEVEFEAITYTLSIVATGNGSATYGETTIRSKTVDFTVNEGASAKISFTPDKGHRIKSVKVNGSEVSVNKNQYTISDISSDTTVEVEFDAITYTLSITATGNGSAAYNETTIRSKTSDFTVNEGASATISFTPDKGYKIKSVTVNGSKVSLSNNQYTVSNIKKNTTVEVEFEPITYTLSIMATGNGSATYDGTTVRSKTSTFTLNEGASATITFTPDEGNRIKTVKVNNAEVTLSDGQYTVENITSDMKVSVEFEAIPHTLTITAKGNGSASCNGKTVREETGTFEVSEGGSAVITFSPDSGHRIKSVKVNGSEITITNYLYMIYTVQDITSDTSVEVEFESKTPTTYNLSITATGNGAVSYNGTKVRGKTSSFKVNAGASATLSFNPDKSNRIKSVSVNNSDVTSDVSDDSYTIDDIREDTNVKVVFEANAVYKLTYMVDGEVYKVYEIEEGAKITPEPEPKKDGYKFSGWSWIPSKMPAEDVVVTGYFTFDGVVKDDVAYAIEGDNASVTNADNANGEIKIEASVSINGKTYQVTSIAEGAFQGCTGLTSVEIPNSVTTIGQNAFNGCSGLLIIKIGNGVKEIGSKAFANIATNSASTRAEDTGLKVYCEADVLPSTATDAFENSPIDKGTLIVKDEMVMVYKYAMPWNGFGSIIGITTDIRNIAIDADKAFIFDMQGNRIDNVRKGVNIIRTRDGKTKKLVVK